MIRETDRKGTGNMEQGNRFGSVSAETNETGTIVRFSNDPENPEGFGGFLREIGKVFETETEPVRETDPEGFRDFDPVPANMERNRKREREELKRNRDFIRSRSGSRSRNVSIIDRTGKPVPAANEPERVDCCGTCIGNPEYCVCDSFCERDGIHNPTYSATIGIGNVPVATIAEWVSQSLGREYGFQITEHLGYWEGIPERSISIVFQGIGSRFRSMLATLARNLPNERFAHVAISEPKTEYVDFESLRIREGIES